MLQKQEEKLCPLLSCMSLPAENKGFPCIKKSCEWFDIHDNSCCMNKKKSIEVVKQWVLPIII